MKKKLLILVGSLLSLCMVVAQTAPTLEQTGSIYYAYPTPTSVQTPAPEGFTPFYISHYGRHGSRWMTSDNRYSEVVQLFDSLHQCSELTPLGEDVRRRLQLVWDDARGRSGQLTPLGERQHRAIAERMYGHFPEVFQGEAMVDARSSTSLRCALSMSYFTERLKELNPSLQVTRRSYPRYMDYIAYTSPEGEAFSSESAAWRDDFTAFEEQQIRPERLMASLFVKPSAIARPVHLMQSLYWIAADMQNVELDLSFYDIFEYDELVGIWKTINARMYICNAAAPLNGGIMPRCAVSLLQNIIESADRAVAKNGPSSDLRFGHDTNLIRLVALMQIEGFCNQESDVERFHLAWQDYRVAPMGANLQLVFFRNAAGEVLVKLLLNENEVQLPIKSQRAPYYSWEDVRAFWMKVCSF